MTAEQFEALARLTRMSKGARYQCARLVLVEGLTGAEAARQVGTTPSTASDAVTACRANLALARIAAGLKSGSDE